MNPYQVTTHVQIEKPIRKLLCPYCGKAFALTWSRYWSRPFGNHLCPNCGSTGHLKYTPTYILQLTACFFILIPAAIALGYLLSFVIGSAGYILTGLCALALSLVMDRYFDTMRPNIRLDKSVEQADAPNPDLHGFTDGRASGGLSQSN